MLARYNIVEHFAVLEHNFWFPEAHGWNNSQFHYE